MRLKNAEQVKADLQRMGKFGKPALAVGLNRAAEYAQQGVRREFPTRFTFRGTLAAFQRAVIVDRATQGKLRAQVKLGSGNMATATGKLGDMLTRHEEAATRGRTAEAAGIPGAKGFLIPTPHVRTKAKNPTQPYRVSDIRKVLLQQRAQRAQGLVKYGSRAVYKDPTSSTGRRSRAFSLFVRPDGIFERTTLGGRSVVRMLYYLTTRVRVPARTRFLDTSSELASKQLDAAVGDAIDQQLRRLGL